MTDVYSLNSSKGRKSERKTSAGLVPSGGPGGESVHASRPASVIAGNLVLLSA